MLRQSTRARAQVKYRSIVTKKLHSICQVPGESRRIRSLASSKCYYDLHKDSVRTRIQEHAHGKRRQLDDALVEIREDAGLIIKGVDALATIL